MPRGKDTRDHEGRRPIDPRITHSQDTDEAPAQGIPRPNLDELEDPFGPSEEGTWKPEDDPWAPEDIAEKNYWDRAQMNVNLGHHPDHENELPPHMKFGWQ